MRTRIVWRIPKADAAMWRACGWNIIEMPWPHSQWSVEAWRYE